MRQRSNALQQELPGTEWKQEASARLLAHRSRRAGQAPSGPEKTAEQPPRDDRHARIAQSVAERYAQAQSYTHYLEQAAKSAPPVKPRAATSTLTVPALSAAAVAAEAAEVEAPEFLHAAAETVAAMRAMPPETPAVSSTAEAFSGYLSLPVSIAVPEGLPAFPSTTEGHATNAVPQWLPQPEDLLGHSPIEPQISIPGNLIEFPRQLIAPRKARPKLAEGPLSEDPAFATPQLRIFEVDASQLSREPLPAVPPVQPDGLNFQLGSHPAAAHDVPAPAVRPEQRVAPRNAPQMEVPLRVAPLGRRLMAASVDSSLIVLGFCTFAASAFAIMPHPPTLEVAAIASAIAFALFYIGYYAMFCSLADATPGMRYARIALCTFHDASPTRREMRWRLAAYLLSGATLGLGLLWSLVDDDHLGWHDRMSRTYQRCY